MTRLAADWLTWPESRAVCAALQGAGHGCYFVGGCVRNTLIGAPVADLDIATPALPEETLAAAKAAGLKAVPTGLAHGTVTLVAGGRPFEVTTFRRDLRTDGRRAEVAFSDRLEDDAARRDFTMNALYAAPDGTLIDPIGGLPDLRAGRLRFIGDPARRIAEDYLRILRFFRFHAWYAAPTGGIDAEALAACAAGVDGLDRVSAERIGHEMLRLLSADAPGRAVTAMAQSGILAHVLPGADARALPVLETQEALADAAPDPIRRLALLGGSDSGARLRLSRAQARRRDMLAAAARGTDEPAVLAYRLGPVAARDAGLIRAALTGVPPAADMATQIARGAAARFPLTAADLMPEFTGPALGQELARREALWIASDFQLSREALLAL